MRLWRASQGELDPGLAAGASVGGPLVIASSWIGHLWDTLCRAYDRIGFGRAAGVMRCSGIWCWRGSSSPRASRTRFGCCSEQTLITRVSQGKLLRPAPRVEWAGRYP